MFRRNNGSIKIFICSSHPFHHLLLPVSIETTFNRILNSLFKKRWKCDWNLLNRHTTHTIIIIIFMMREEFSSSFSPSLNSSLISSLVSRNFGSRPDHIFLTHLLLLSAATTLWILNPKWDMMPYFCITWRWSWIKNMILMLNHQMVVMVQTCIYNVMSLKFFCYL